MDKMQGIPQSPKIQSEKDSDTQKEKKHDSGSLKGRIVQINENQDINNLNIGKLRKKAKLENFITPGNVKQKKKIFNNTNDTSVNDKQIQAKLPYRITQGKVKQTKEMFENINELPVNDKQIQAKLPYRITQGTVKQTKEIFENTNELPVNDKQIQAKLPYRITQGKVKQTKEMFENTNELPVKDKQIQAKLPYRITQGTVKQTKEIFENTNELPVNDKQIQAKLPYRITQGKVKQTKEMFEAITSSKNKPLATSMASQLVKNKPPAIPKPTVKSIIPDEQKTIATQKSSLSHLKTTELQKIYDNIVNRLHTDEDYEDDLSSYSDFFKSIKPLPLVDRIPILVTSLTIRLKENSLDNLHQLFDLNATSQLYDKDIIKTLVKHKLSADDIFNSLIKASDLLTKNKEQGLDILYNTVNKIKEDKLYSFDELHDLKNFVSQLTDEQVKIILSKDDSEKRQETINLVKKYR